MRSISRVISCVFLYVWFFACILLLFRPYQLMGVKRKLFLVCSLVYQCLDTLYRIALQALGISYSKLTTLQTIPLNFSFGINVSSGLYSYKTLSPTNNKAAGDFVLTVYRSGLFWCIFCHSFSHSDLPNVYQTRQRR